MVDHLVLAGVLLLALGHGTREGDAVGDEVGEVLVVVAVEQVPVHGVPVAAVAEAAAKLASVASLTVEHCDTKAYGRLAGGTC